MVTEFEGALVELTDTVVGQRIVGAEEDYRGSVILTLNGGRKVRIVGWGDCCAYADVNTLAFNLSNADHAITSVVAEDGEVSGERWFIFADLAEVLSFNVESDEGNGYYGYGISISVEEA